MASTLPGESSAHPADEAQALRDEIEQTREHLGDTVEQLAAKADVKKQARAEAARLGARLRVAVARARGQALLTVANARKTAPGQARHALDKGARTARKQQGPLAAAVGALITALAALITWKRRKRSTKARPR
jgi:LPXTG-motif cell wall-anchored protein